MDNLRYDLELFLLGLVRGDLVSLALIAAVAIPLCAVTLALLVRAWGDWPRREPADRPIIHISPVPEDQAAEPMLAPAGPAPFRSVLPKDMTDDGGG